MNRRKKIILWAIGISTLLCLSTATFCRLTVEPGHDLVFNAKPLIFLWTGGVNSTPLRERSAFAAPTTSTIDVIMLPSTFDEEFKDIMPEDNNPVDYHAAVRLRIVRSE
jgi:hypothetical protein